MITNATTPPSLSFDNLTRTHTELSEAAHHIHMAWLIERNATGNTNNEYATINHMILKHANFIYEALQNHPDNI